MARQLRVTASTGNVFRAPDEFEVYFQTEHIVDAGDLSVPQMLAIRQPTIVDGRVVGQRPSGSNPERVHRRKARRTGITNGPHIERPHAVEAGHRRVRRTELLGIGDVGGRR